ncbi:MAG: sugar transferase [Anaerolineae bacterium]|nr:sugar transferase [Anaerolineae bacterium]MCB0198712.1 sugar transferase [Anaerolineae bacterium]MCB0203461.1 sugar transferase [Anaerolineae bacterium]MCB0253356.1 sugar transferase [Anaerolineae bacterium]
MRKLDTNTTIFLIFSDLAITLLALFIAIQARFWLPYGVQLAWDEVAQPWAIYLLVALIWGTTFVVTNVYNAHRSVRAWDEVQAITFAIAVACLVFAGVLYLTYREVPRRLFFYFVMADLTLIIGFRFALRGALRFAGRPEPDTRRVLVVGTGRLAQRVAEGVRARSSTGLVLVGLVDDDVSGSSASLADAPVIGTIADTPALVKAHGVNEVVFALPLRAQGTIESLVLALQEQPVSVRVVPDYIDLAMSRATIEDFNGLPLVGLRDPAIDGFDRVIKRVFDLGLSLLTLLIIWPVLLLVAAAVKLDSPGPALFIQERIGENGRPFRMVKFRSMVVDADTDVAEEPDNPLSPYRKSVNDPRVTRVGRFIRRTSLDELPQLFNVLRGDMSLVGPRPELPRLVEHYENWQRRRFAVPPGITGWWQVNGRSDRMMHQHTEDDLYYIQNYSPLLDVQILWRTIGVVVRGRGAF